MKMIFTFPKSYIFEEQNEILHSNVDLKGAKQYPTIHKHIFYAKTIKKKLLLKNWAFSKLEKKFK